MAIKKELLISAKFDTSDFDKSVERMQNKLKDLYAPSDMIRAQTITASRLNQMGIGGMQPGSKDDYAKTAMQNRRDLDGFLREQAQGQEKLSKILDKRVQKMNELKDKQKELTKGSEDELRIKEQISRMEENSFRLRELYKQRDQVLNQGLDARNKVAPRDIPGLINAFRHGGFKYGMSQIPGAFGQNPVGMGGGLVSAIGAGLNMGGSALRDIYGVPIRTEGSMGNAVSGTMGRDVQNIYGRRSAFEQMFQPERQRAAEQAIKSMQANRVADYMSLAGNATMIGGGLALAAKGSGIGAAAAGAGTLGVGAPVGAAVGALPGLGIAGKGMYNIIGDERQRSLALSGGGLLNNRYGQRYQSLLAEQMAGDYQKSYEAQKQENPFKTQAVGEYEQNFMRNLQFQRQTGMKNGDFYGPTGFMRKNMEQGFTPEMGMEMAGSIQGAGGSTRMGRESVFGNQLSRQFDLTNAGSVLGNLSGGLGSSEATKSATIRILAEGMKLGLDDSKFAEENRRFTQAAAEIISRSGANTEGDFQKNAKNFSQFMGENTNMGIEGAKTAYEQYQQISSTTTGPRGVMRAAGFMKDKYLSQLNTIEKQGLMQLKEEELNENNPMVSSMAEKVGLAPQDFISRVRGVNQGSVSRFKEADDIRDRLRTKGVDMSKIGDKAYFDSLSKENRADIGELMSFQTAELGNLGSRGNISRAAGTVGRGEQFGPGTGTEAVDARMAGETGRMEDTTVRSQAMDASIVNKEFLKMQKNMDDTAKSALQFGEAVRILNVQLQQALEDARAGKGSSGILDLLKQSATLKVQPQTTKPGGQ